MPAEKSSLNDIAVHDTVWIPLKNGLRLAARVWLPVDAERAPVSAILEYTPYRRRDPTTARDERVHPYFARLGYASVRVDIHGSGDSDGVLLGKYRTALRPIQRRQWLSDLVDDWNEHLAAAVAVLFCRSRRLRSPPSINPYFSKD